MAAVLADMAAASKYNATVCIKSRTPTSTFCPGGVVAENVAVPLNFDVDVYAESPVCWQGTGAGVPVWDFYTGGGSLHDFASVACVAGDSSAIRSYYSDVEVVGPTTGDPTKVTCMATANVAAATVADGGRLTSSRADYDESTIGVHVSGPSTTVDPTFISTDDLIRRNDMGILVEGFGVVELNGARVSSNEFIGLVSDDGSLSAEFSRFDDNIHPECGKTWAASGPWFPSGPWYTSPLNPNGIVVEDRGSLSFINTRWLGNCTHQDSQQGLIRAANQSSVEVRNATTDDNETWAVVQVGDSADAAVHDNIFADDANAYGLAVTGSDDNGVECNSAGAITISHNAYWNLDTPELMAAACSSSASFTADPQFATVMWTVGSTSFTRYYHLNDGTSGTASPYIDAGSAPASTLYPSGGFGTESQPPLSGSWVDDTGTIDLGWHWSGP